MASLQLGVVEESCELWSDVNGMIVFLGLLVVDITKCPKYSFCCLFHLPFRSLFYLFFSFAQLSSCYLH
jgi:hypothetical protein